VIWGCDELQGYLFSKPLEAEAFEKWASDLSVETNCVP
jgi:EAL domain-containing protein (putative c-di-GMP-specific phosphodiesterase class I)